MPELVYAEVGNSLLEYVRADGMNVGDAAAALEIVSPCRCGPISRGARAGRARARGETGLSAYDCCYAVLAESLDAPLVTADRRLAAAVPSAELLS